MDNSYINKFSSLITREINRSFARGALRVSIFTIISAVILFVLDSLKIAEYLLIPAIWVFICGVFALLLHLSAKNEQITGAYRYYILFPIVSLPMVIYIISYFLLPSGTATYLTGPPSYIFIMVIIITGFLFEQKISIWAGAIVALEYFIVYLLGREHLQNIICQDNILRQSLTGTVPYIFKSVIFFGCGIIVGTISFHAKELIEKIMAEEMEKQAIDKLFGQFVSAEVKDKIISEKKDKIAEKKKIAILFTDIRYFTTMCENLSPEQAVTFLNRYLDKAVGAIERNGGIVDKFVGDAIVATFGGVIPLDSPAKSALEAAKSLLSNLKAFNEQWTKEGHKEIYIGIGIHYGEVFQGSIGSSERKEFTVIGDTVNTTSRIESLTKIYPYPIIITEAFYKMLPDDYKKEAADLGEVKLKGKKQRIRILGLK
jgi:class 3 adenylate cyclase